MARHDRENESCEHNRVKSTSKVLRRATKCRYGYGGRTHCVINRYDTNSENKTVNKTTIQHKSKHHQKWLVIAYTNRYIQSAYGHTEACKKARNQASETQKRSVNTHHKGVPRTFTDSTSIQQSRRDLNKEVS